MSWQELGKTLSLKVGYALSEVYWWSSKRPHLPSVLSGEPSETLRDVVDKAETDILNMTFAFQALELTVKAPSVFSLLKEAIFLLCPLHNMYFLNFLEEHESDFL